MGAGVEEPAVEVGGVVEVDAAFEDGVRGYAEVAAEGGHARGWGKVYEVILFVLCSLGSSIEIGLSLGGYYLALTSVPPPRSTTKSSSDNHCGLVGI